MSTAEPARTGLRIKGTYAHLDTLLAGIEGLQDEDLTGFTVLSPLPRHEIEEAIYDGQPSPVRWWTLCGALLGLTIGFLLPALTHAQWPMINPGGKPVVSLPPFIVIMFECTILGGGLATFAGFIFHSRLPSYGLDKALQDPRYSDDKFGIVFLDEDPAFEERITEVLTRTGAIEVTRGAETVYEVPNV